METLTKRFTFCFRKNIFVKKCRYFSVSVIKQLMHDTFFLNNPGIFNLIVGVG